MHLQAVRQLVTDVRSLPLFVMRVVMNDKVLLIYGQRNGRKILLAPGRPQIGDRFYLTVGAQREDRKSEMLGETPRRKRKMWRDVQLLAETACVPVRFSFKPST